MIEFDRFVDLLYAGVTSDTAFRPALEALAQSFGCRSAVMAYADRWLPGADLQLAVGPFEDGAVWSRYLREFAAEDPAPRALAQLQIGQAASTDALFGPDLRAGMRFLTAFYYPLGLREALGGPIAVSGGRTGMVAVHRGPDRPSFQEDEVDLFARLLVHFARAFDLRQAFFRTQERADTLADALDAVSAGTMAFDARGRLIHANAAARAMLAAADGLALGRTGRVRATDPAADVALQAAIAAPPDDPGALTLRMPRAGAGRPYVVRVRRAPPVSRESPAVRTWLFIADLKLGTTDVAATLAAGLGLTHSSAALVEALLSGKDMRSYAKAAGITTSTAKFHLGTAFAATGTTRQADLVRLATTLLKDLGT